MPKSPSESLPNTFVESATVPDEVNDDLGGGLIEAIGYAVGLPAGREVKTVEPREWSGKLFAGEGVPANDLRKLTQNGMLHIFRQSS